MNKYNFSCSHSNNELRMDNRGKTLHSKFFSEDKFFIRCFTENKTTRLGVLMQN